MRQHVTTILRFVHWLVFRSRFSFMKPNVFFKSSYYYHCNCSNWLNFGFDKKFLEQNSYICAEALSTTLLYIVSLSIAMDVYYTTGVDDEDEKDVCYEALNGDKNRASVIPPHLLPQSILENNYF